MMLEFRVTDTLIQEAFAFHLRDLLRLTALWTLACQRE